MSGLRVDAVHFLQLPHRAEQHTMCSAFHMQAAIGAATLLMMPEIEAFSFLSDRCQVWGKTWRKSWLCSHSKPGEKSQQATFSC